MVRKGISLLLLSGGVGSRSGYHEPKQFYELNGKPMIAWSFEAAACHEAITEVITNAPVGFEERTRAACRHWLKDKPWKVVSCGASRQESVKIMLQAARHDRIMIHEAARPMITTRMIDELAHADAKNAGFYASIPYSVCTFDPMTSLITGGVPRDGILNVQLPQIFDRYALEKAHRRAVELDATYTEDSLMVHELAGEPVTALTGHAKNIKVTTPEDFHIAAKLLQQEHAQ